MSKLKHLRKWYMFYALFLFTLRLLLFFLDLLMLILREKNIAKENPSKNIWKKMHERYSERKSAKEYSKENLRKNIRTKIFSELFRFIRMETYNILYTISLNFEITFVTYYFNIFPIIFRGVYVWDKSV